MKPSLRYGLAMALVGAVLIVVLYLLGLHSDPAKLVTAQVIGTVGALVIGTVCISLGIKARRDEIPAGEEFTYGQAFGTGFTITLFAALFGIITSFTYAKYINPAMTDVIVQAQLAKFEAKGMTASQIEAAEKMVRSMMSPTIQAAVGFFVGLAFGTVISLVVAAFLKRRAVFTIPDAPPTLT